MRPGWGKESLPASRFEPGAEAGRAVFTGQHVRSRLVRPATTTPHPVRGARPAAPRGNRSPRSMNGSWWQHWIALERQLGATEDRASIENIQTAYGYYLATLLWDDLTALFAEDGTIEIAMRGIYVGRPAVRRNLNLYGQAGLDDDVLHNHMQYQMVINVAPDGQTAKLRSRALSMMGNFGKARPGWAAPTRTSS